MSDDTSSTDDPSGLDAEEEQLTPADVGASIDGELPFVFSAGCAWTPLVISVPHAGLAWPADLHPRPHVNLARNADFGVDQLFAAAPSLGAALLVARFSRLVVDLNRAEDDVTTRVVADHPAPRPRVRPGHPAPLHASVRGSGRADPHRGVVWDVAVGNISVLSRPLRFSEFEARIDAYHRPYYRAVEILLERRRRQFGFAVLLDAHSMPSSVGLDVVLGTIAGRSCGPEIAAAASAALDAPPWRVRLNTPYQGGALVARFGRPDLGVHALQLEVNRALYMDELGLRMLAPLATEAEKPRASARSTAPRSVSLVRERVADLVRALAGMSADALAAQ